MPLMPTPAAGGRCRRLQKFGAMRYILRRPRAFWISGINLLGLACSMVGVVMLFYRRRKQEATTHGEEPEQHQENVAVIRAVTSGIDRVWLNSKPIAVKPQSLRKEDVV
jgi:hypothetical protein